MESVRMRCWSVSVPRSRCRQAINSTRPGGYVGYVGVPHGLELQGKLLFFSHIHLHGGPAPVRRFLPELIDLVWNGSIKPGKVFDLTLPLDQVADAYRAMDQRHAIKALTAAVEQEEQQRTCRTFPPRE
jgi:threonine dehydrogenase-like Zn-dependent dehydrogenase